MTKEITFSVKGEIQEEVSVEDLEKAIWLFLDEQADIFVNRANYEIVIKLPTIKSSYRTDREDVVEDTDPTEEYKQ